MFSDDPTRDLLIKTADEWFKGIIWSTIISFVGTVMQNVHPLDRLPTHTVNIRRQEKIPRKWILRSKWMYKKVAVLFAIGGIVGVGIFEVMSNMAETAIRARDEAVLASTVSKAGNAATSAYMAQGAAGKAQERANAADEASGKANNSALLAQQHATKIGDELTKEIAQEQVAEQKLESEKLKRLKLAASLMPRQFFGQSGVSKRLSSLPPIRVVLVYVEDEESKQYAEQIAWVFAQSGWQFFGRSIPRDKLSPGVSVTYGRNWSKLPPAPPTSSTRERRQLDAEYFAQRETTAQEKARDVARIFSDAGVEMSNRADFAPEMQNVDGMHEEPPTTLLIGIGPRAYLEIGESLKELGKGVWGNRTKIPLEPPEDRNSGKP